MSERIHHAYDGDGVLLHVETWSLDTDLYIREDPPGTTVESRPLTDAERAGLIADTHPSDADRLDGLESRLGVAFAWWLASLCRWVTGAPIRGGRTAVSRPTRPRLIGPRTLLLPCGEIRALPPRRRQIGWTSCVRSVVRLSRRPIRASCGMLSWWWWTR